MNCEELFLKILNDIPGATQGKMFGALAAKMQNGKAGAMFKEDKLLVKISGKTLEEALKLNGVSQFTPMEGRPMGGWYEIPAEHCSEWKKYAEISCAEVAKMEPNKKKRK